MSNKAGKKTKLILTTSLATVMSVGTVAGITIPTITSAKQNAMVDSTANNSQSISPIETPTNNNNVNTNVNNNTNSNIGTITQQSNVVQYKNTNDGRILTDNLTFKADINSLKTRSGGVTYRGVSSFRNAEKEYNKKIEVTTISGEKKSIDRTTSYENNRKYMPILAYDGGDCEYYGYTDTRKQMDVMSSIYPGWDKVNYLRNYNNDPGLTTWDYYATSTNKRINSSKIQDSEIKLLQIVLTNVRGNTNKEKADVIKRAIETKRPQFIQLIDLDNSNMEAVGLAFNQIRIEDETILSNVKKMVLQGGFTNLNAMTLPESLLEIEFRASKFKHVNPLKIPASAAIIYDSASYTTTEFEGIELTSSVYSDSPINNDKMRKHLTDADLQKAVDAVYTQRIKERSFQGHFAGGYISSWNLRKTGLYSFNNVKIPLLQDGTGRFYIAYVSVETDGTFGPNHNEVIGGNNNNGSSSGNNQTDKPSNDSQIGEWFDWNENGWSQVQNVNISTNGVQVSIDVAAKEIIGFINKYPNIKSINISNVQLKDGKSLDELETKIKEEINKTFGPDSKYANITINKTSDTSSKE